jgi:hypothetical protein
MNAGTARWRRETMARFTMAHYTRSDGVEMEYWRSAGAHGDIRVWPIYHRDPKDPLYGETTYKAQGPLGYSWEMTGPEHQRALQEGLEYITIRDSADEPERQ